MNSIPNNLEEAIIAALNIPGADVTINGYPNDSESFVAGCHDTVGRWMRNNWGLWAGCGACPIEEAPLYYWFYRQGLIHPDDISGVILKATWSKHLGKEYDLQADIARYQEYWDKIKNDEFNRITEAVQAVINKNDN